MAPVRDRSSLASCLEKSFNFHLSRIRSPLFWRRVWSVFICNKSHLQSHYTLRQECHVKYTRQKDYSKLSDTIRTCQRNSKLISDLGVGVGELIQDRNFGEWTKNCLFIRTFIKENRVLRRQWNWTQRSGIHTLWVWFMSKAHLLPVQKVFVTGWLGNRADNSSKCTQFFRRLCHVSIALKK